MLVTSVLKAAQGELQQAIANVKKLLTVQQDLRVPCSKGWLLGCLTWLGDASFPAETPWSAFSWPEDRPLHWQPLAQDAKWQ